MAKPTGALLSFSASGTIAKTAVFASWRGRQYVRRHVVPHNPRSDLQTETRSVFTFLSKIWQLSPQGFRNPWQMAAQGRPVTDRNLFAKANISPLRPETDLSMFIFSTGAAGGIPLDAITVTPGSGDLVIGATPGQLPPDWNLDRVVACAILDVDPHGPIYPAIVTGFDTTSPYSVTLSGLTGGSLYRVAAWPVYFKPDGSLGFGPATQSTGTPS